MNYVSCLSGAKILYFIPLGSLTELFCFYYHPYLIKRIERGNLS